MELKPCPTCGSKLFSIPNIAPYHRHNAGCAAMTLEEALVSSKYWAKQWIDTHNYYSELTKRMREQAVLWQGKRAIVRHENNKLRRALYRRVKAGDKL